MRTQGIITSNQIVESPSNPIENHIEIEAVEKDFLEIDYKDLNEAYHRHLDRIKKIVLDEKALGLKILDFLEDRFPSKYNSQQLSGWVGVSHSTVQNNPPKLLLHIKMITRERGDRGTYYYRSNVKNYLKDQFELYRPELTDEEFQVLFDHFKEWIQKQIEV